MRKKSNLDLMCVSEDERYLLLPLYKRNSWTNPGSFSKMYESEFDCDQKDYLTILDCAFSGGYRNRRTMVPKYARAIIDRLATMVDICF